MLPFNTHFLLCPIHFNKCWVPRTLAPEGVAVQELAEAQDFVESFLLEARAMAACAATGIAG